jgi:putative flippase GtrA
MPGMQASTPNGELRPGWRARLAGHRLLGQPLALLAARREEILYLVVGGWNTVFGYGLWALLQFVLGERLHYLAIVVISWPLSVLNNYLCYRYLVFRSRGPILRELPRFSAVYSATLLANLVMLPAALQIWPGSIYVVQAAFMATVIVVSYLAHKHFSFRGGQRTGESHR